MNGVHDLGGQTCFGPVVVEADEPVFHEDWERRMFALMMLGGGVIGPIDTFRYGIERGDPTHYLQTTYYEHWLAGLELLIDECGVADIEPVSETLDADVIDAIVAGGVPATREAPGFAPRFKVGDRVLAKNMHPRGHTRLPRYCRGHHGTIEMVHGNHVFPDAAAAGDHDAAQALYCVRFDARELWGEDGHGRDSVRVDLWESYLEAA